MTIYGDVELNATASAGNGTLGNPYIIESYFINASGKNANGIEIANISAYFILQNCTIIDGDTGKSGIQLVNVTNGNIYNNSVINNGADGISLLNCNSIRLDKNKISGNNYGINISLSSGNVITNNTISNNLQSGIHLDGSSTGNQIHYNLIFGNVFYGLYSLSMVDATKNWWGAASGPGGLFPGAGDNASGLIICVPWYATPTTTPATEYVRVWYNPDRAYSDTIQGAINAATSGDNIEVTEGTYYEQIVINKSTTLLGSSPENTTIDGGGTGDVILITSDGVTISSLNVTGGGTSVGDAGIKLDTVEQCIIKNNNISGMYHGISLNNCMNSNITGNKIHNNTDGINLHNCTNILLDSNIANNNNNGINLSLSSGNIITNNAITNNTLEGIHLDGSSTSNQIHYNSIFGNTNYGLVSLSLVDAEKNWWGAVSGPGAGDNVSGIVDYEPWYATPTTTPATEHVSVRYNPVRAYSDTIQGAIDAAQPGDDIDVSEGTYYEHLTITKSLTLQGSGRENTTIDGGGSGNVIQIIANGVIIAGLNVTGGGASVADAVINLVGANQSIIENNYISRTYHGIYLNHSSNNTVTNNTIHNNTYGIYLESSHYCNITWNVFYANSNAFYETGDCVGNQICKNYFLPLNEPVLDLISPNPSVNGIIQLTWSAVANASHYYVFRSTSPITDITSLSPIAITTESNFTDTSTVNGDYFYVTVAGHSEGNSSISNCENVTILVPPGTPFLHPILPEIDEDGSIEVQWSKISEATTYFLYRDTSYITSTEGLSPIAVVTGANYTDSLTINDYYYYAVVAGDGWVNSSVSNCQYVSIAISLEAPFLSPILPGIDEDGIIMLDWSEVVDAGFYYIYRDTSYITSVEDLVAIANVTETNYTDIRSEDRFVYYVVVAGNPAENSSISNCQYVLVARDGDGSQPDNTWLFILVVGFTIAGAIIVHGFLTRARRSVPPPPKKLPSSQKSIS